jgi:hypothetical protein
MVMAFGIYLLAHITLYFVVIRYCSWFRREWGIFLYHVVPAAFATGMVTICADGEEWDWKVILLGIQGIYSLSFLELWSLAQGGYSLRILDAIETARKDGAEVDGGSLEQFGARKRALRINGLAALGLIQCRNGMVELTRWGRHASSGLQVVARLVNLQSIG